jgi:hypothetical protein
VLVEVGEWLVAAWGLDFPCLASREGVLEVFDLAREVTLVAVLNTVLPARDLLVVRVLPVPGVMGIVRWSLIV